MYQPVVARRIGSNQRRLPNHGPMFSTVMPAEATRCGAPGIAGPAVLGDHQAGHGLEHFAVPHERALLDTFAGERTFARRVPGADGIVVASLHDDRFDPLVLRDALLPVVLLRHGGQ